MDGWLDSATMPRGQPPIHSRLSEPRGPEHESVVLTFHSRSNADGVMSAGFERRAALVNLDAAAPGDWYADAR